MKKLNINFEKVGKGILTVLQDNSGTVATGVTMVLLAVLCKKLDIPYQVLTNPYDGNGFRTYSQNRKDCQKIMLVPNNSVEASIGAIINGAMSCSFDYQRTEAAKQALSILASNKENLSESTKTYTVALLQQLSDQMSFSSGKNDIGKIIMKIGKGEF